MEATPRVHNTHSSQDAIAVGEEEQDLRRRTRQERLHELRGGPRLDWVQLDRLNPAKDDMPMNIPAGRDRLGN
eukprot:7729875-Pyramimonas_sp.AAC.1